MIHDMLTYCRPHGSEGETEFIDRFISHLPGIGWDKFGNGMLRIGTAPILWSVHTDTVHHASGRQEVRQKGNILSLAKGKRGLCLGADDAAGIWIALHMIEARVSGLYIFHAAEEHGGLGSSYITKKHAGRLEGIQYAIAFDRKGTNSVITHQGSRTCSDEFAWSLATLLGKGYRPDDTGTFTDTANYTDLIGECTNISVGYEGAHSEKETLDIAYLERLRDTMIHFDPSKLVHKRQPGEIDEDEFIWMPAGGKTANDRYRYDETHRDYGARHYDETLIDLCANYPHIAARLLESTGMSSNDILDELAKEKAWPSYD